MLDVNFTTADNVTTDALYQWDINQVLSISGLSLPVVPSIHFCNKKSTEALIVNCTAAGSAITCEVPNALLAESYDIIGYICTACGEAVKTDYTIRIPVTPRVMPSNYVYDDNIPVHTFEAVESEIRTLDASLKNAVSRVVTVEGEVNALDNDLGAMVNRVTADEANIAATKPVVVKNLYNIAARDTLDIIPASVVAIKRPDVKKVDIHIDCSLEAITATENFYGIFNAVLLRSTIGVNTLNWDAATQSRVILESIYGNNGGEICGRTGLKFTADGSIGRAYLSDMTVIGGWAATNTTVYAVGNHYHIDVWGADYT